MDRDDIQYLIGGLADEMMRAFDAPTLRDRFAMAAMQGLLAQGPHDCSPKGLAHDAYLYADAMLEIRERKPEDQ